MELQFVLPFAYWHFKNGTLSSTMSSQLTKEFYFFSDNHKEVPLVRSNRGNYNFEVPRILYSQNYNIAKWLPVPLKDIYSNNFFVYKKPILIIANRYNMEWDGPPISYLSIDCLDVLIKHLKPSYQVIYNRPHSENISLDGSQIYELNEYNWLKQYHPDVLLFDDIYNTQKHSIRNFNHLQLCVYANCSHFISVHGGTATLASYFGGTNIILSKQGPEHHFNCYEKLYPKFSGAKILHAKNEADIYSYVEEYF